jgi:hypothetical protein
VFIRVSVSSMVSPEYHMYVTAIAFGFEYDPPQQAPNI